MNRRRWHKPVNVAMALALVGILIVVPVSLVGASPGPDLETLRPNADGSNTKWDPYGGTGHWECVDEVTPDTTTYVYTSANNKHDSYNLEDHTNGSGAISNVRVYARALSTVEGDTLAIEVVIGGLNYEGAQETLTATYVNYLYDWAQNPATTAAWTWTEIDALEAGVRDWNPSGEIRVTTVWVEVTYTPDWQSYESDLSTPDNYYDTSGDIIYMKGTGFAAGTYIVRYYDATTPTQVLVGTDANIIIGVGVDLTSQMACNTDEGATAGTWHAKAYLSDGTTLIADDTFTVTSGAIPEFPTVITAIVVAGLCFGIYYWMRKRRLGYAEA